MDAFLQKSRDFDSRSQLCRAALDNYINILERKGEEVLVRLSPAHRKTIDEFVRRGYFVSRDEVIREALRNYLTDERTNEIDKELKTMKRIIDRVPTITLKNEKKLIER